jgi:hypothetical protein
MRVRWDDRATRELWTGVRGGGGESCPVLSLSRPPPLSLSPTICVAVANLVLRQARSNTLANGSRENRGASGKERREMPNGSGKCWNLLLTPHASLGQSPVANDCVVVYPLGSPFDPGGVRTEGRRTTRLDTSLRHLHFHTALASRHH